VNVINTIYCSLFPSLSGQGPSAVLSPPATVRTETTFRSCNTRKQNGAFSFVTRSKEQSQLPRDLRRGPEAAGLLVLWVRIPPGVWISVSCACYVLSGLYMGLITRPEESHLLFPHIFISPALHVYIHNNLCHERCIFHSNAPNGEGQPAFSPSPKIENWIKNRFCRQDDIKLSTRFTL